MNRKSAYVEVIPPRPLIPEDYEMQFGSLEPALFVSQLVLKKTLTAVIELEIKKKIPAVAINYVKDHPLLSVEVGCAKPDYSDLHFTYDYADESNEPPKVSTDPHETDLLTASYNQAPDKSESAHEMQRSGSNTSVKKSKRLSSIVATKMKKSAIKATAFNPSTNKAIYKVDWQSNPETNRYLNTLKDVVSDKITLKRQELNLWETTSRKDFNAQSFLS